MYEIDILMVEDDLRLVEIVKTYVENEGFHFFTAKDGEEAEERLFERDYHVIILDVMLPDTDGWTILRNLRKTSQVPVIMLTARSEEDDRLFGFEMGADDYVTKPFSAKELIMRIKALLKRTQVQSAEDLFTYRNLKIELSSRKVYIDQNQVDLTPNEYDLLKYFIDNQNIALSREKILNAVWGYDYFGDLRTVDTHIKRLRKKLGDCSNVIETVRGVGYRMEGKHE